MAIVDQQHPLTACGRRACLGPQGIKGTGCQSTARHMFWVGGCGRHSVERGQRGSHGLANANWGVYDKAGEKNALLEAGASGSGGWPMSQLTESGKWVRNYFHNGSSGGGGGGGSGGCCKFGADCGDCGDDGTGWCHMSASNCATCTGTFDPNSPAPGCR